MAAFLKAVLLTAVAPRTAGRRPSHEWATPGRAGGDGSFDDLFHLLLGELGGVRFAHLRAFGSRASRTASPIIMKLRTVMARAEAG